ncbi:hypothetical protein ACSOL8_004187 [Salmonella enterica subsp. enterica serovar Newport]
MADLLQFASGKAGHFHEAEEAGTILQHRTDYFQGSLAFASEVI